MGRLLAGGAVVAFFALMGAIVCGTAIPASLRLTAPVLCPADTTRSVVVTTVSHYRPGQTSVTADLVCIDVGGHPEKVGSFRAIGLMFAVLFGGAWVLILPMVLFRAIFGRRSGA